MKLLLEDTLEVANGIWLTHAPSHQLAMFGQPKAARGRRSVLLASSPTFEAGRLVLETETIVVLNVGTSPSTIVIDTIVSAEALNILTPPSSGDLGPGDREFLSLVERELTGEAQEAAVDLLRAVRLKWAGDLKKGERNNFSNTPDNFWYVIVQPRNQALSITVRGSLDRFQSAKLALKIDRPGYTRFNLQNPDDVPEALRIIEMSKRRQL